MGTTQRTVLIIVLVTVSFLKTWKSLSTAWSEAGRLRKTMELGISLRVREIWRKESGGMPLIEEYHSKTSARKDAYDYVSVWWDAKAQQYQGI